MVSDHRLAAPQEMFKSHAAIPVFHSPSGVVALGPGGLAHVGQAIGSFELPHLDDTDDEVVLLRNAIVGVTFGNPIALNRIALTQSGEWISMRTDLQTHSVPNLESYCVPSSTGLAVVIPSGHYVEISAHGDLGSNSPPERTRQLRLPQGAELVAFSTSHILAIRDSGIQGEEAWVFNWDDASPWFHGSSERPILWWVCGEADALTMVLNRRQTDRFVTLDSNQSCVEQESRGPVGSLGGDDKQCLATYFDGFDEHVVRVCVQPSGGNLAVDELFSTPGRKLIGRNVAGWLVQNALAPVAYEAAQPNRLVRPYDESSGRGSHFTETHLTDASGRFSRTMATNPSTGATGLQFRNSDSAQIRGTLLHLHGGPESYETDEQRFFGLPSFAVDLGWEWRTLNYRGSLSPDPRLTRAAWRDWHRTLTEDSEWALAGVSTGPVVVVGWSFGAAAALAIAAATGAFQGLIVGGLMGALRAHVEMASSVDPAHRPWFEQRFDIAGTDGEFFSGAPPRGRVSTRVVSFHGQDDPICPYDLAADVRRRWKDRVDSWEHYDLPGAGHFAECREDAALISERSRNLLVELDRGLPGRARDVSG